jgi:arabinose-5-phosphate isomerase
LENAKILQTGIKTISNEIEELKFLCSRLDENFVKAVRIILKMKGKLVICGIGKSAHVAQKMTATFNSTGTPSQFLHASEAKHGDLGLLSKDDVAICLSNSGTSAEIQDIAPFLKAYSSALVVMTGNLASPLAELADVVLDTHINKEADPNNLAPTSSTTVQIALGDALAVALIEARNFTSADFAKFHPGGALGRKLLYKVEQLVKPDRKPQVRLSDNLKTVITSISYSTYGITVVVENEKVLGVITDGDLRRTLAKDIDYHTLTACEIMTTNPKTIQKNELASTAFDTIKKLHIGQLIVLDDEKYFGIISLHTLLDNGFN